MGSNGNGRHLRVLYNCSQCPAYCCSYDRIIVSRRDVARIARHFNLEYADAEKKYTKLWQSERVLRHKDDHIFARVCQFLDTETRRCTIYDARPEVCREYPDRPRCGYYEFLSWERNHQDDPEFIPKA